MRRRDFITLLGSAAAAWPLAARAQPKLNVGYLSGRSTETDVAMLAAFRHGLGEGGYVEGRNLAIEYRFADGRYERMATLLTELAGRKPEVIAVTGVTAEPTFLLQMKTSQIPIVFIVGADPVRSGLVASLNRPGGNVTGICTLVAELMAKELGLLRELVPSEELNDTREAIAKLGLQLNVLNASTDSELNDAFATLDRQRADAILVTTSPFYMTKAKRVAELAAQYRVPAIYVRREYVDAGGLMSYGYDISDSYRLAGVYSGRILKGDRPGDLPVLQPTKFQLVVNLKTAKELGLTVPDRLLALADEVID
jgi:putative ABC transport system substrate-binding protein